MRARLAHGLGPLLALTLFSLALYTLHHELKIYHLHDILRHLEEISLSRLLLASSLTAFSYLLMTGYDAMALRYVEHPLPLGKTALASFVGYAFSNNIGLSMFAGGSVRYRLYSGWGLSLVEITKVVVFCSLTLWLGFLSLGGMVFALSPMAIPSALPFPFDTARPLGGLFLFAVALYVLTTWIRKKPIRIRHWALPMPPRKLLVPQLVFGIMDWAVAGTVLYSLLPTSSSLSWLPFLGIYLLAQFAGLVSQVPGGIGVFESLVILLMSPILPATEVLGPLLAFRGLYYLLPLLVSAAILGAEELVRKKGTVERAARAFLRWEGGLAPHVLSFTAFVGGAILLFSGATPAIPWRLTWLRNFIPLPVIEASHFLGSIAGAGLLILARSLQRRIDAAYLLTLGLLGAGILFSLLKGFDFEEATILLMIVLALLPCRSYFYRRGSLTGEAFEKGWFAAVFLVLLCSVWLGLFSYKHVEYSDNLWWQFSLNGDAPRFLRATAGAIGLALFFALSRLLRPSSPRPVPALSTELNKVIPIIHSSPQTYAHLALLGDKSFLISEGSTAFIMYGIQGRSWIAMRDPIGVKTEWPELLWRFREMCDRYDGWTVFYEVGPEHLDLYLDLGLSFLKIGEEARVPLQSFTLEGGARKGLRYTYHKLGKEGCTFEVIPSGDVSPLLAEFRKISDAWLQKKNTREKGFSLGFFDETYLTRFPAAVVRKEGKVVAFTNIWQGADKEELSVDLMRFDPEAPGGVMEYLHIQLMLWAKEEGYRWFNLGMAPLSGLENREPAPLWSRLEAFVFRHGEHFYNLQGLRQYKSKFAPRWTPKYLASPGGMSLPRVLASIASLISGGLRGVITK
jgi:phosphatidylglycerol lysyltransferase